MLSDSRLPVCEANTSPEPSASPRAPSSTSSARADNGTRCSRPAFVRKAGTVQVAASGSISSHRAPRTSPERHAVNTRNSNASFVAGHVSDARTLARAAATSL